MDDDAWALATTRDAPVRLGLLNHRGDWGARVRSAAERGAPEEGFRGGTGGFFRCSRCDARGPSGAALVTFPCGHTFHDACAPEEVCVACLVERGDGEGGEGESSSAWGEKARVRAAVDAELRAAAASAGVRGTEPNPALGKAEAGAALERLREAHGVHRLTASQVARVLSKRSDAGRGGA